MEDVRLVEWARSFHDAQDAIFDDPKHALELAAHSLRIAEHSLGQGHPCTAWSVDTLGFALSHRDSDAAEAAHLQAFSIRDRVRPRNLHDINQSLVVLENFYASERRYEEAAHIYRHQIALNELHFANDHLESTLFNFATFSAQRGDYAAAVSLLQRAMRWDRAYGESNTANAHVHWRWLAKAHAGLGHMDQATDALRQLEAIDGPYGLSVAAELRELAEQLERQGQHERAHALFLRQRRINESPTFSRVFSGELRAMSAGNLEPGLWESACRYAENVPWELVAEIDP